MELVQLPLKKKQHVSGENQEACILEIVLRLESEFSKLQKQLLTSNSVQEELLKELKIYNKSRNSKLKTPEIDNKTKKLKPRDSDTGRSGLVEERQLTFLSVEDPIISGTLEKENATSENSFQIKDIRSKSEVSDVQLEPTTSLLDTQALVPAMPSHNEADNTNDSLYFVNDTPQSINKPWEVNVQNPGIYLPEVKEEINETDEETSWPMEAPGSCSSNDNISLIDGAMQPENEVVDHDHGVVIKVQEVTDDQSVNGFDESHRFNQPTNPIDQAQSESCYKCENCDRIFVNEGALTRHMKAKHPDRSVMKRHKCELCSFSSDNSGNLKNHLRVHAKEKPLFQCTVCSKRFVWKSNLTRHIRTHTKECPYECNKCGKMFKCLSSMQRHIRSVHDVRNYKCQYCDKRFGDGSTMRKHERIHTGEKPYKCKECSAAFTQSVTLRTHERIHTGEKPYKCKECLAAFSNLTSLRKHVIIHHS